MPIRHSSSVLSRVSRRSVVAGGIAATGLVATLIAPHVALWPLAALVFIALSFVIVFLLSGLAAATARLAIDTTVRFYWQCTLIFAVLVLSSALFMRLKS